MATGETTITVVGNLTDDPEYRVTPQGVGMAKFRVASTPRVFVVGRLRLSQWEDKDTGQKRSMIQLDVDEVGPSLRFATATVKKMTRSKAGDGFLPADAPDDVWATATA